MLRRHAAFSGLAAQFTAATLLDLPARGAVAQAQAGEAWITV
jgi:hypothetical protein